MESEVLGIVLCLTVQVVLVPSLLAYWYWHRELRPETSPLSDRDDFFDGWSQAGERLGLSATVPPPRGLQDAPRLHGSPKTLPVGAQLLSRPGHTDLECQFEVQLPFPWQHLTVTDDEITIRAPSLSGTKKIDCVGLPATAMEAREELAERASEVSFDDAILLVRTPLPNDETGSSAEAFTDQLERLAALTDRLVGQGVILELTDLPGDLSMRIRIEPEPATPSETIRAAVVVDLDEHWPAEWTVESTGNLPVGRRLDPPGELFEQRFDICGSGDIDDELRIELLALQERFDDVAIVAGRLQASHLLRPADEPPFEELDESIERAGGAALELFGPGGTSSPGT